MNKFVTELTGKKASDSHPNFKIHCFETVISYFNSEITDGKTSAQEMLEWLQRRTVQTDLIESEAILVVWSATDPSLSPDVIQISDLMKDMQGYPFGLMMEHAAVFVSKTAVFQKASLSDDHHFEIVPLSQLVETDHGHLPWIRFSFHKLKSASIHNAN